jgi:hypothetical protein
VKYGAIAVFAKHVVTAVSQSIACCRRCAVLHGVLILGCQTAQFERSCISWRGDIPSNVARGKAAKKNVRENSSAPVIIAAVVIRKRTKGGNEPGADTVTTSRPGAPAFAVRKASYDAAGRERPQATSAVSPLNDAPDFENVPARFGRIDGRMFSCNVHRGVVGDGGRGVGVTNS